MLSFIIEKDYIDKTDDDEDEWIDRQIDIQRDIGRKGGRMTKWKCQYFSRGSL